MKPYSGTPTASDETSLRTVPVVTLNLKPTDMLDSRFTVFVKVWLIGIHDQ